MNDQNEQTILDWLKENLTLRGLRSLFLRPPKAVRPVVEDSQMDTEVVHAETQEQLPPATLEPNVLRVSQVPEAIVQTNEVLGSKIAHVVITAYIPEGMTLNLTIQANAAGKASISSRIIPAQNVDMRSTLIASPKLRQPQIFHAVSGYFDKSGKLIRRRWQWVLAISALLVYLFVASFLNSRNIIDGVAAEVVKTDIQVEGQNIELSYSPIDMGQPKDIFDDDFVTLIRGAAANPYILDFNFSEPRHLSGIFGQFAKMDYQITVDLFPPDSDEPIHYDFTGEKITTDVELEMVFDNEPDLVKRVYIEILQLNPGQEVHVHIREIKFLP